VGRRRREQQQQQQHHHHHLWFVASACAPPYLDSGAFKSPYALIAPNCTQGHVLEASEAVINLPCLFSVSPSAFAYDLSHLGFRCGHVGGVLAAPNSLICPTLWVRLLLH
jgi:hypothetical protein